MAPSTTNRARLRTFGRYTAGSIVAAVLSELAFLGSYTLGAIPLVATVVAWFAGAVPNYLLNRYWAWRHRSRADAGRELLPYAVIVVVTTAVAALVTTLADTLVHNWVASHTWQTLFVGAAYLGTYGIMFVLKFVLFDRLVFSGGRARSVRSRSAANGTAA